MSDTRKRLEKIRGDLESLIGKPVKVRANQGRRRTVERIGTIEETYPSVFVVRLGADHHHRRVSFTYTDVLTEAVEVTVLPENENDEPKVAYSAT